ncbi:3'5'-cyclic nucleotide phosphodiesterase family protein [Dorcoceras hygrometricum]|uniref:3'5'-cyclic nucleotide phosphodiesterase family protein n=1 Tax=Dorcoceras hygrometricum TaxID=472368 RepID=A0A2Z7AEB0_9LAMI|nr:3'5'-cyclic nucleotide phosphodiesterase family protein [Dorcoceras hygrometricum]
MNNVDAYDDVKAKTAVVKEETSWEGNQVENQLKAQLCSSAIVNKSRTRAVQLKKQPAQCNEQTRSKQRQAG